MPVRPGTFYPTATWKGMKTDYGAVGDGVADDTAEWQTWLDYAIANPAVFHGLDFEGGRFNIGLLTPSYLAPFSGVRNLVVWAYDDGEVIFPIRSILGGTGPSQDFVHSARIKSVSAGSTVVELITPSENSRFAVGQSVMLSNIELQFFSYPYNHWNFEYPGTITNISGAFITVEVPLINSYLQTFPDYDGIQPGGARTEDYGGPATIYGMNEQFWNCSIKLYGYHSTFTGTGSQTYIPVKDLLLVDCEADGEGFIITSNKSFVMTGGSCPNATGFELDKGNTYAEINGGWSVNGIIVQSSSTENLRMDNFTVANAFAGLPKNANISNGSIGGTLTFGPISYGRNKTAILSNVSAAGVSWNPQSIPISVFTIDTGTGILRVANSSLTSDNDPVTWGVPGANVFLYDSVNAHNLGQPFTISDVWRDATYTYLQTDVRSAWPAGILADATSLAVHPAPRLTASGLSGCKMMEALNGYATEPLFGRVISQTIDSDYNVSIGSNPNRFRIWGNPQSMSVNITRADTGTGGASTMGLWYQFGANMRKADGTTIQFAPQFNCKIAGLRSWTKAGGWTGLQSGDSGLTDLNTIAWLTDGNVPYFSSDMTGYSAGQTPLITFSMQADQGIPPDAPLVRLVYRKI